MIGPGRSSASRWFVAASFALALMAARAALAETVLVESHTTTSYRANPSDPGIGTSWTAEAFDDTAWGQGTYGVGYETAPPGAVRSEEVV